MHRMEGKYTNFSCLLQSIKQVNGTVVKKTPYQNDSTASCLLSEVKHYQANLVLQWGTTFES